MSTILIAIDVGQFESAILTWDGKQIEYKAILKNEAILDRLEFYRSMPINPIVKNEIPTILIIEKIVSYGKRVGLSTFDTAYWSGRFVQTWDRKFERIPRSDVKISLCGSVKGITDTSIRAALIDRFGEPGTKKNPNPITYGLKTHLWQAFALAVMYWDKQEQEKPKGKLENGWREI